jgi:superfamily I DNA/RNA helicase
LEIQDLDAWQDTYFFESVKDRIKKYDVVLIDEIQDYMQSWIDIIMNYFTHSESELVVFGDEKQNIYERELDDNNEIIVREIPARWNKSLNVSHRFASNIGNIAIKFQKSIFGLKYGADELKVMSQFDFEERIIEYHFFHSFSSDILFKKVYSVLERNKIHSSDAGILCSKVEILRAIDFSIRTIKHENTSTAFESQEEFLAHQGNHAKIEEIRRLKKNHFYLKTGTVKLSTIHSFKGWEIDTLFLFIEKDEDEEEFANAELIYTGLTRARKNLVVFNLGNRKYDDFFKTEIETKFEYL